MKNYFGQHSFLESISLFVQRWITLVKLIAVADEEEEITAATLLEYSREHNNKRPHPSTSNGTNLLFSDDTHAEDESTRLKQQRVDEPGGLIIL